MSRLVDCNGKFNRDRDFLGLYHSRIVSLVFMVWLLLIVLLYVLKRELAWSFSGWPTTLAGFGSLAVVVLAILDTIIVTVLERKRPRGGEMHRS